MNQYDMRVAKLLTYSGTIPFIGAVILPFTQYAWLSSNFIASTYGAVIISFLCGIHWAYYLLETNRSPFNLLVTSNLIALLAWVSILVITAPFNLMLQAGCFIGLLTIDARLAKEKMIPAWFFTLRRHATIIVVVCLLASIGGQVSH